MLPYTWRRYAYIETACKRRVPFFFKSVPRKIVASASAANSKSAARVVGLFKNMVEVQRMIFVCDGESE